MPLVRSSRRVGIIGPHDADEVLCGMAREAARLVWKQLGAAVICGGLGGVMEAAAEGAQLAGGICIGVLPGADPAAGNAFLTVAIATGLGQGRNQIIVNSSDALISIGTNEGTEDEIRRGLKAVKLVVSIGTAAEANGTNPAGRIFVVSAKEAVNVVAAHNPWRQ